MITILIKLMQCYIDQTKTLTGVIFHYTPKDDHVVESLFYSNAELEQMALGTSPEFDEAKNSTSNAN